MECETGGWGGKDFSLSFIFRFANDCSEANNHALLKLGSPFVLLPTFARERASLDKRGTVHRKC